MRSRDIYMMISVGLFFRVCISLWNAFWGPSIGANADATSFHKAASNLYLYPGPMSELSEIATKARSHLFHHPDFQHGAHLLDHFYSQLLAWVYFISTESLFIGSLFSVFAWAGSAVVLIEILNLLEVEKRDQFIAMGIYSLLPSSMLFTGVTLREPFQLLLVNLAMLSALKIYLHKSIKFGLFLVLLIFIMEKFHFVLYVLGAFMVFALTILLILEKWRGYYFFRNTLISIFFILTTLLILERNELLNLVPSTFYGEKELSAGVRLLLSNLILFETRTQYINNVEINGIFDLMLFMPKYLLQYLFEPMPWSVRTLFDFTVLLENLLRAALILKVLANLFSASSNQKLLLFVILSYLGIELTWSIGTANWGTAIRHHVPGMGLLIASAFAYSKENSRSPFCSILK